MKKALVLFLLFIAFSLSLRSQPVKGLIYADTMGIRVVKLWGTHQERGYALGYLTGAKISNLILGYIKPMFGSYYNSARNLILQGNDIVVPQDYQTEAQGIVDGMNASGNNSGNLDMTDLLVSNSFLDIQNLLSKKITGLGCSALMSWDNATMGTDLDGKSVVSRHLDWTIHNILLSNHTIIIHFPSEVSENKWLHVGFSGMIGTLSGLNEDLSAFQHQMSDFSGSGLHNKQYTPVWFAMRRSIEAADYNGDGSRNVQDVRSSLSECLNGFADGFIVSAMARSNAVDSLAAMVAELTPSVPRHTYRYNTYPDSIPGDNLYAANEQIKRNNAMNMSARYNNVRNNLGDGTGISRDLNWTIMRDYSHQSINLQFIQFVPELNFLQVSVYRDGHPAYYNDPVVFDLNELFADPSVSVPENSSGNKMAVCPNPASGFFRVAGTFPGVYRVEIADINGRTRIDNEFRLPDDLIRIDELPAGIYSLRATGTKGVYTGKVLKSH